MRNFIVIIFICSLWACNGSASNQKNSGPSAPPVSDAVTFQMSRAETVPLFQEEGNWCKRSFKDAALISADRTNYNRRFFRLDDGVFLVGIEWGGTISSFMVRGAGEKKIELFTSKNFPECLSSLANYTVSPDATTVAYDNKTKIRYSMDAQRDAAGLILYFDFPPGSEYGLSVHRCTGCN